MINHKKGKAKAKTEKETCLTVLENDELLSFLIARLPRQSRNNVKSLLTHRQVSVDDEVISMHNYPLQAGQKVRVDWGKARGEINLQGLKILFEDQYLIAVEKPARMLSVAAASAEPTAYNILSGYLRQSTAKSRIFIVHRLDRDTSGAMLFAKSAAVQETLQNEWKDVVLERSYAAVVEGSVAKEQGTITSWLKENKAFKVYSSRTPGDGQKAVTHYRVLKKNNAYSLLDVKLETGRKNQIRVHLQDIGHSVVGDKKYGATKNPLHRLGLHAQTLSFVHPVTGHKMSINSPLPPEFLSLFGK
ncbi:MAG: RluA family pseudouridine synthase [bacterium]|jgi:23S rRNA pseudouridine1911/1915/1917 synthase